MDICRGLTFYSTDIARLFLENKTHGISLKAHHIAVLSLFLQNLMHFFNPNTEGYSWMSNKGNNLVTHLGTSYNTSNLPSVCTHDFTEGVDDTHCLCKSTVLSKGTWNTHTHMGTGKGHLLRIWQGNSTMQEVVC